MVGDRICEIERGGAGMVGRKYGVFERFFGICFFVIEQVLI